MFRNHITVCLACAILAMAVAGCNTDYSKNPLVKKLNGTWIDENDNTFWITLDFDKGTLKSSGLEGTHMPRIEKLKGDTVFWAFGFINKYKSQFISDSEMILHYGDNWYHLDDSIKLRRATPQDFATAGGTRTPDFAAIIDSSQTAVAVTAEQYYKDYTTNAIAADNKYENKKIEITGTITDINKDLNKNAYIELSAGDDDSLAGLGVWVYLKDAQDGASLVKGQRITFVSVGFGSTEAIPSVVYATIKK